MTEHDIDAPAELKHQTTQLTKLDTPESTAAVPQKAADTQPDAEDEEYSSESDWDRPYSPAGWETFSEWRDAHETRVTQRDEDDLTLHGGDPEDTLVCQNGESSYTSSSSKRVYDTYTSDELYSMVQARRLQDPFPGRRTLKYTYIMLLESADRVPTFHPFMRLAPELRVIIYCELLTMKTKKSGQRFSYPQILRVSRHVNKEAGDLLYSKNQIRCTLTAYNAPPALRDQLNNTITVHGKDVKGCERLKQKSMFPDYLRRLQNLQISIRGPILVTSPAVSVNHEVIRVQLAKLTSYLMDQNRLKTLTIELCPGFSDDETEKAKLLFPLRRLRNIKDIVLTGDIEEAVAKPIKADIQSSRPCVNVVRHWTLLGAEVDAYYKLRDVLGDSHDHLDYCECDDCLYEKPYKVSAEITSAKDHLDMAIMSSPDAQATPANENHVLECLENLSIALSHLNKNKLRACIDKFSNAVEKRRRYDFKHRLVPAIKLEAQDTDSD